MNKFLVAASIIVAGSWSASAADLALRPTAGPGALFVGYDWSGVYVGANGGEALSRNCWSNTAFLGVATVPNFAEGCSSAAEFTLGAQIGYRWQSVSWVFGLEAQGNWANLNASNQSLLTGAITNSTKTDAFGLFTGQVGYSIWESGLIYLKGGAAVTSNGYNGLVTVTKSVFDTARETRWGAVAGIGGEYGFAPNWSFGIEWNHLFMGNRNISFTSVAAPAISFRTESIRQDIDIVTARISYHWSAGPGIVTRY